ncbi:hypothetical protein E4T42_04852 [Aureobasidium subglaciale]|nr:hypothetical protein E4T42_04852 [Aureobasidium subglaciale]
MIKAEFYDIYGSGFKSLCIGSERRPEKHSRMRKSLSAAFSTKALTEQEQIINSCVDQFVSSLDQGDGASERGLNMTKWFEMIAFDILGEMAFGESFGCIESGKPHFWSELIEEHLFFITIVDNLRRYPLFVTLGRWIMPLTASLRDKHTGLSREKVAKRLSKKEPRKDFMSHLIRKVESGEMDQEELTAHASTLVIAGGETVSTFLAACTYYLLKNPKHLGRLQTEIRQKFSSYADINATKAQQLPFLQAVISEGLRIYPPGSRGFPRISTGGKIDGHYIPPGVDVYTSAWTVTHDEQYFKDPFTFNPERWLDAVSEEVKEASQPFSLGTRGCLGRNFAYVEMNLIMAKMYWKYDMTLVDNSLEWEEQSREHVMWTKPELLYITDIWTKDKGGLAGAASSSRTGNGKIREERTKNAAMAWDVMNRRYDFPKPMDKYKLLEPYGPNVATTEGKNYQFHVRITAPPFGDLSGVNSLVWRETLKQTQVLCEAWSKESSRSLSGDLNALTLSVISLAGFGKQINWTASDEEHQDIPEGYIMSFLKAISDTTGFMVAILLFPGWLLRMTPLKKANDAHMELDKYLRQMIRNERGRIAAGATSDTRAVATRGNLLTSLLEASHSESKSSKNSSAWAQKRAFTEDEVMGNLFIYLLAGYETTANSIYYGLALLAVRPDIQNETIAEIDRIYGEAKADGRDELTYEQDFEKLHYLYGFMIKVSLGSGKVSSHILPPETRVYLNTPAVHYSEKYWPNPTELDPSRWMPEPKAENTDKKVVAADRTRHMRGTLLTFSDGARSCLGRKFAQAEYIAFLTSLLRNYRVELEPGQDVATVRRDLDLKCAGKVTLAPLDTLRLTLKKRNASSENAK